MTEEFGVNGVSNAKWARPRRMSGETPQARVNRYKEERKKQLAGQFANLLRSHDSSSSSSASDQHFRKTSCRVANSNGVKDEDVRKPRILNNYKNPNKVRYKDDFSDPVETKQKSNGSVTSDSPSANSSKSGRDKSAKRKSFLNTRGHVEKTPSDNHNHNHHNHLNYHSADEGNSNRHWNTRTNNVPASSLPVPVAVSPNSSSSPLSLSPATATATAATSSSHKPSPSPSLRSKLAVTSVGILPASLQPAISSKSACNGFAQTSCGGVAGASSNSISQQSSAGGGNGLVGGLRVPVPGAVEKATFDKSRIPRRVLSPPKLAHHGAFESTRTDRVCDTKSSELRARDVDTIRSEVQPTMGTGEYPNPTNSSPYRDTTAEYLSLDSFKSRSDLATTTTTANEDLFTQKNPLLDIIHNFSERNVDAVDATSGDHRHLDAAQTIAENGVNGFQSANSFEGADLASKRSLFVGSKSANVKNGDGLHTPTYHSPPSPQNSSLEIIEEDNASPKPSILKKKQDERSNSLDMPRPNSILKRKTADEASCSFQSIGASYRQGILKKHSSLDEEEVRRRSCSPDVDVSRYQEFKPILKTQRRSSLEELVRNHSPELHSILKRSKACSEEASDGSSSPHGILKRKVSVVNGNYERRSLEIEVYPDVDLMVRPILKNKQHSLDFTVTEKVAGETPRPILKKKQSSEVEVDDERPKKPILKSSRKSLDEEELEPFNGRLKFVDWSGVEDRIKPILKKRDGNRMDTRSVKSDDDTTNGSRENAGRVKRHSLPGSGIVTRRSYSPSDLRDRSFSVPNKALNTNGPLVDESKVQTDEKLTNGCAQDPTAARALRFSRNSERYRTQPITHEELVWTKSALAEKQSADDQCSTIEMESSTDEKKVESTVNSSETADLDPDKSKLEEEVDKKADTDEMEVISKLRRSNSVSAKASLFAQLARESKKASEDCRPKKRNENVNRRKLKVKCSDLGSRFATQPVTWEEVAEAKKQNLETRTKATDALSETIANIVDEAAATDHSYLSISERVKMFMSRIESESQKCLAKPTRRPAGSRFNTQPVTTEEVQMARKEIRDSSIANLMEIASGSTSKPESACEQSDLKAPVNAEKEASPAKLSAQKLFGENSSETGSQSEGDTSSSGGREIQSIIGGKRYQTDRSHENRSGTGKMNFGSMIAGATDVVDDCPVINGNSSIAQRLAALQRSGQKDWQKRISRIVPEKEVSPIIKINEAQELLKKDLSNGFRCKITSEVHVAEKNDGKLLADRLEKLETASQTWKKRVGPSDAVQFSVAGKMASTLTASPKVLPAVSPLSERKKRGPCPSRFRSFREPKKELHSVPASPEKSKSATALNRSNSLPSESADEDGEKISADEANTIVSVPQIFDDSFSTFFGNVETSPVNQNLDEANTDFSVIKMETPRLLPAHKKVRAQRKHATSGNPLKTLATRIEIKNEYREVKTNVADREIKRMNVEKLSKNSSLAVEVLAGLASKEDFAAVQLKKAAPLSSPMLPYKPLMLLHIKGRRHVQTRLVEPIVDSVNSGDSYVLVTPNEVYHWIGQYSNVIERSRGAEIAQHIVATHDLGCSTASHVNTIVEDSLKSNLKSAQQFWTLLDATPEQAASIKASGAGYPDEDEVYESSLISTNMVYQATEDELVPFEKYWATIPKIHMLDPNKVLVFDFGSELYVWMGKNVDMKLRKSSVRLAKELWENGFNYEECDLCPVTSAGYIGVRDATTDPKKRATERPEWCLFAKVTQHMETVLFREKFLDWPDFSRVIRAKGKDEDTEKQADGSFDVSPCDAKQMLETKMTEPDLVLEGSHLGRGCKYFDEERKRYYMISTSDVRMWHIAEFDCEEVSSQSMGQFYSTDSYVVKWVYSISYTGRELSGQPSKHTTMGRDRCVYFCWQGKNASLNEQGAAALLTVELDKEKGVQLRICQGYEPPAFFNLFKGRTVIYKSKKIPADKEWRLFICRGEIESEAVLLEVSCNIRQLRSRASFVLMNLTTGTTFVWHGCKVTKTATKICQAIVNNLTENPPPELELNSDVILNVSEINEGSEPKEFFKGLGSSSRKLYMSLMDDKEVYDTTPSLFTLTSTSGTFCATPIWSPCRHTDIVTAYPFLQEDLYSASQPALFLMDTGKELWLWQGWWPEREDVLESEQAAASEEATQNSDKDRGSATIRWQAERRAAMVTVLDYWKLKYADKPVKAFLVWAGLEPIQFTNLFPDWNDRDDVAEINIMDGRKCGEVLDVEQELERLTQSTYPIEQLLQRPLPDGVDPTKLELYLSASHFKEILNVTKEEFAALPSWKQTNLKKNAGLF